MGFRQYFASEAGRRQVAAFHAGHRHSRLLKQEISRRRFMQSAAGLTAVGAALGSRFLAPGFVTAAAPGIGDVVPIPGGTQALGGAFHLYVPPGLDAPDDDPSTVFNLDGVVGLAYISGTATETNRRTGASREAPFNDADMRFMKGRFRGRDGHEREGTFAFI